MLNKIIDKYYSVLGFIIHIERYPKSYEDEASSIYDDIEKLDFESAKAKTKKLEEKWGQFPRVLDISRNIRFSEFKFKNYKTKSHDKSNE